MSCSQLKRAEKALSHVTDVDDFDALLKLSVVLQELLDAVASIDRRLELVEQQARRMRS